jgi:hypothetical protein
MQRRFCGESAQSRHIAAPKRLAVRPIESGRTESSCLTMIFSENRFPLFAALTFGSGPWFKDFGP